MLSSHILGLWSLRAGVALHLETHHKRRGCTLIMLRAQILACLSWTLSTAFQTNFCNWSFLSVSCKTWSLSVLSLGSAELWERYKAILLVLWVIASVCSLWILTRWNWLSRDNRSTLGHNFHRYCSRLGVFLNRLLRLMLFLKWFTILIFRGNLSLNFYIINFYLVLILAFYFRLQSILKRAQVWRVHMDWSEGIYISLNLDFTSKGCSIFADGDSTCGLGLRCLPLAHFIFKIWIWIITDTLLLSIHALRTVRAHPSN